MHEVAPERSVESLSFAFGAIPLTFESTDRRWLGYLKRRYGAFGVEISPPSSFVLRFEPTTAGTPEGLISPLALHLESVRCEASHGRWRVESDTSSCDIDLEARRGTLRGPSAMYPLDNVLRHLLPVLVPDGLIVHGAALADDEGRGFLACGPSGAGKSTLARLASPHALSDELAAVESRDGRARATLVSLPFWESRPGRAALHALLLLRHGEAHRLEAIRPEAALKRLTTQILWPVWDECALERSFARLTRVVETVPAFELFFAPRPDVWSFLREEVP